MVGQYGTSKINQCILSLFLLCISCTQVSKTKESEIEILVPLKSGDLIVRQGTGYFSDLFRQMGSRDKKYSHIGIISKEQDSLFVYHIEADEFTGEGFALREQVSSFINKAKTYTFFENQMDSIARNAMLNKAKEYVQLKVKFDLNFNAEDDDKLYCTELVAKSINYGLDSVYITPTTSLKGRLFYGLDDIYSKDVFKEIK